jgi:uncharacterized protein
MRQSNLFIAVSTLANFASPLSEEELEQPWQWRYHAEGVRFALIGSYHDLRELGNHLHQARYTAAIPTTSAHHLLGNYHSAYRDFQAVLLGVSSEMLDQTPAPGEWTIREIVSHVVYVKCAFFTLIHDGLLWSRQGGERPSFSQDRVAAVIDGYADLKNTVSQSSLGPLLAFYDRFHHRVLDEFADISDVELQILSPWWESDPVPLSWRLHRFDAHLREHTIQLEKTLLLLNTSFTEGKRQARQLYLALADVEKQQIGATILESSTLSTLANTITARMAEVSEILKDAAILETAVTTNNLPLLQQTLKNNPALVDGKDSNRLPITLAAAYRRQKEMVDYLIDAGAYLDLFTSTAVGLFDRVQEKINRGYWQVNQINIDGFAPLQLAAFFGHEAIAIWLIEQGADVNATAANASRIRPVHAAAAIGNLTILNALLKAGADVNVKQAGGFTPLHAAAQSNNLELAALLLEFGADQSIKNDADQTAYDIAKAAGHKKLISLLD